uniref:Tyrosine specific protein phosphatases domain-containing protein n=1 Tax=Oryza meridionalis TaxID=40149 RepID=A0A0E0CJ10_9ORYZ
MPAMATVPCFPATRGLPARGAVAARSRMAAGGSRSHSGVFLCRSSTTGSSRMEDYNTAMKRMMRNPYEYHHDLGMNYAIISDSLIVGSQPQKPEDIDHLKNEEKVAFILCLQQDKDIEYWGIDFQTVVNRCKELGIKHIRRPAVDFDPDSLRTQLPKAVSSLEWAISEGKGRVYVHCTAGLGRAPAVAIAYMFWFENMDAVDFDPDSLRTQLPKAVSSLEWAISEGKGRVYVHCTAGLGRAPAVAIAYMFWFENMDLKTAYEKLTSKRPCGPNKRAIRAATYDLAKNDPHKESFDGLPEHAFEGIADSERRLIQERVRALREA